MLRKGLLVSGITGLLLLAQETTQLALSDGDRARYWRNQYELAIVNCTGDKTIIQWNQLLADLSKKCGIPEGTTNIVLDSKGEPSCPVAAATSKK